MRTGSTWGGADTSRPLPEDVVERLSRQRAVYEYFGQRANLDNFLLKDPTEYVKSNAEDRPWLRPALEQGRDVQRVFASVDSGGGHFLQRHEGFAANDQRLSDRLIYRRDPVATDTLPHSPC